MTIKAMVALLLCATAAVPDCVVLNGPVK